MAPRATSSNRSRTELPSTCFSPPISITLETWKLRAWLCPAATSNTPEAELSFGSRGTPQLISAPVSKLFLTPQSRKSQLQIHHTLHTAKLQSRLCRKKAFTKKSKTSSYLV